MVVNLTKRVRRKWLFPTRMECLFVLYLKGTGGRNYNDKTFLVARESYKCPNKINTVFPGLLAFCLKSRFGGLIFGRRDFLLEGVLRFKNGPAYIWKGFCL